MKSNKKPTKKKNVRRTRLEIEAEHNAAEKKYKERLNRLRSGCTHKNTERWSDYEGINEQCKDCGHWIR